MVFQFKIQIKDIAKPPVWRRITIPADFTFLRFHYVIQKAFGWEDCGGIYGYENIKEVFETMPESKEANGYREWLGMDEGEIWDTGAVDIEEINLCLEEI
ncbi:MAG: plasmid pRiA4b ORF-3 family protein [Tannerellaceae bacterium]|jgi:hypothetical protein|nr:plasmid pRiA4b ORF-3 family protein [Tannerellaceae bacterium]